MPVLVWYPDGVRLSPQVASTWNACNDKDLRALTLRLSKPHVYSYYGYGLRNRSISAIADSVLKRFALIYTQHTCARLTAHYQDSLDPTKLWPVVLDSEGNPLVAELVSAGMADEAHRR